MPIIKRIVAFLLDVILVGLICVLFSVSPLNVNYDKIESLQTKYVSDVEKLNEEYEDKIEDEEEANKYLKEYKSISENYIYENNRLSILENIVLVVVTLLYFVGLPYFMEGQTLGKKIMKVRIVDVDGKKLNLLNLTLRALILYGVIFNIFSLIALVILDKTSFVIVYTILSYLSYGLDLAIIFTTLVKEDKRGLHDMLAKTKVERVE